MGVAAHLGIDLREYDARIRTFIPGYDAMLDIAAATMASLVSRRAPLVVDLGIGTGALAERCLRLTRHARIVGIDEDEGMLGAARARLGRRLTPIAGSFEAVPLPRCDAAIASLALHHIPTPARRLRLFRRIHRALRRGGVLIIGDCYVASDARLRAADRQSWLAHLRDTYTSRESAAYLRAWAKQDFYVTLSDELRLLSRAGFSVDIIGRWMSFAVIAAAPGHRHTQIGKEGRRHTQIGKATDKHR
jgi:tRNA (cmo5U34)-methyltransferase